MKTTPIDHKRKNPSPVHAPLPGHTGETAHEHPSAAADAIVDACDRLAAKLDEVGNIFREQLQASPPSRETLASGVGTLEAPRPNSNSADFGLPAPNPNAMVEKPFSTRDNPPPDAGQREPEAGLASGNQSVTATAENARLLIDSLARSRDGWQEQATNLNQALASIMGFLENQAANASPKIDVLDIKTRLRNLEEQQQTLQSQFNTNRWSPS